MVRVSEDNHAYAGEVGEVRGETANTVYVVFEDGQSAWISRRFVEAINKED